MNLTPEKLKMLRAELRLTQKQFAENIGKSVQTIQSIECGRLNISQKFEMAVKCYLRNIHRVDLLNNYC